MFPTSWAFTLIPLLLMVVTWIIYARYYRRAGIDMGSEASDAEYVDDATSVIHQPKSREKDFGVTKKHPNAHE